MTISEQTFRTELDGYLKRIGGEFKQKKNRNKVIREALLKPVEQWDEILEGARILALEEEAERSLFAKVPLESYEQKELVKWFKATYPTTDIMMIRNDGTRTPAERTGQLLMGLLPGASDLFIPDWLCWVEMKRAKKSLTEWNDKQQGFAERRRKAGQTYLLCYGFKDAKRQITEFLELIGNSNDFNRMKF